MSSDGYHSTEVGGKVITNALNKHLTRSNEDKETNPPSGKKGTNKEYRNYIHPKEGDGTHNRQKGAWHHRTTEKKQGADSEQKCNKK